MAKHDGKTMQERVMDYMRDFGSITTLQAFRDLGCSRLSEYIRRIRLEYVVTDEWESSNNRYGDPVRFKKYKLGNKYEQGLEREL